MKKVGQLILQFFPMRKFADVCEKNHLFFQPFLIAGNVIFKKRNILSVSISYRQPSAYMIRCQKAIAC